MGPQTARGVSLAVDGEASFSVVWKEMLALGVKQLCCNLRHAVLQVCFVDTPEGAATCPSHGAPDRQSQLFLNPPDSVYYSNPEQKFQKSSL